MKKTAISTLAGLALVLGAGTASAQFTLNEIRVDHSGADVDEYVEIAGTPGSSLAGVTLLVIGDTGSVGTCGIVETVIDLSAFSIQADGLFCLRYSAGAAQLTGYDADLTGSFENSDTISFMLVRDNQANLTDDLDAAPEDGVLDSTPWSLLIDSVAIYEGIPANCTTDEHYYATPVGPDGAFSPGHIYRCTDGWHIGPFGTAPWPGADIVDTPGAPNACTVGVENKTWGTVKNIYR